MIALSVVLIIASYLQSKTANAAYCSGSPNPGNYTNEFDISNAHMVLIKEVPNGKLYEAGPKNARFPVVHVWGTPYEMGFAQGQLQKRYAKEFADKIFIYLTAALVNEMGDKANKVIQEKVAELGINRALDWTASVTAPFTPQSYYDELKGISDASGIDYDLLLRLNMIPELTKASCSFFGAWSAATTDGSVYQLRSLDYDTDGPFKDYPQLTVYHPSDGSNAFVNMGWPCAVGALTAVSQQRMAISEIGVSFPDDSFGQGTEDTPPEKVRGKPWMYVLRDMLQYTNTLEKAIESIETANRTCNLIIGVGDGKQPASDTDDMNAPVYGIEYSGYVAIPYTDTSLLPSNETWHPYITNVVYNGMDWLCPTYTEALGQQLQQYWGNINKSTIIHNILPTVQSGDLHIAVYDLTSEKMYVSFCRSSTASETEPQFAYERQFTELDLKDIFSVPAPVVTTP